MIKNLNPLTYNKYGDIIYEDFSTLYTNKSLLKLDTFKVHETNVDFLYTSDDKMIINNHEGIALVLLATKDNIDDVDIFLLDKIISINAGIYYRIISLYGVSTIKSLTSASTSITKLDINTIVTPCGILPKFSINKVLTLFYQEKEVNFRFKGEKHNFWELTYVDTGVLNTKVEDNQYELKQGQLIFYGPNQYHEQNSTSDNSVCFMTITFYMEFDNVNFLTDKIFNINTELKHILEKILSEYNNNLVYTEDLIIGYLKEFIIKLIRSVKLENTLNHLDTDIQNNIENSIVNKTVSYIENNIDKKLTIPLIASTIPISASYLSRTFKKHMNTTIVEYINTYKLHKGKELIRTSKYNFTQIANMLGYNSVHYFSKQFKKYFGVSPTNYSKSIKK